MRQPDSLDVGTKMDVARHRLNIAKEDLDTAHLTFEAGQYRGSTIERIIVSFIQFVQ